jgi:hypothetical protein
VTLDANGRKSLKTNYLRRKVARPERFELPTLWFEARCSIQLSYGREATSLPFLVTRVYAKELRQDRKALLRRAAFRYEENF